MILSLERGPRLLFTLAAALLAGACSDPAGTDPSGSGGSGGSGGGGNGGGGGDPVAALDAVFQAACERQVECGYPVLNSAKTVDACLTLQRRGVGEVTPTLGDGAVILREDRLVACKAALEAATCEVVANQGISLDEACTTYWEGTVKDGEPCAGGVANDCAEGSACVFEGNTCPGVCTKIPPPCVEGSCEDGSYCDALANCTPRAAIGQACGPVVEGSLFESSCVDGAHCVEETCVARIAAGQSCSGMYEFECVEDHTCQCDDAGCSTLSCAPAAGEGEACNTATGCAEGRYCDFDAGTCADRGDVGAACSETAPGACKPGLACIDGACDDASKVPVPLQPLLKENDDCAGAGICPLGTTCLCAKPGCQGGERACLPGPKLGESCEEAMQMSYSPFVCAEGLCDVLTTITCIEPAAPGAECTGTQTFACGSFVCIEGKCATLEETRCEAS